MDAKVHVKSQNLARICHLRTRRASLLIPAHEPQGAIAIGAGFSNTIP